MWLETNHWFYFTHPLSKVLKTKFGLKFNSSSSCSLYSYTWFLHMYSVTSGCRGVDRIQLNCERVQCLISFLQFCGSRSGLAISIIATLSLCSTVRNSSKSLDFVLTSETCKVGCHFMISVQMRKETSKRGVIMMNCIRGSLRLAGESDVFILSLCFSVILVLTVLLGLYSRRQKPLVLALHEATQLSGAW